MNETFIFLIFSIIILTIPVILNFPRPVIIGSLILQSLIIMITGAGIYYNFKREPIESAFMLFVLVIAIHLVYTNTLIIFRQYNIMGIWIETGVRTDLFCEKNSALMGAWIETQGTKYTLYDSYVGAWIETKLSGFRICWAIISLPTWERELKPQYDYLQNCV